MKRLLLILIVVACVAFAGCLDDTDDNGGDIETTDEAEDFEEAQDEVDANDEETVDKTPEDEEPEGETDVQADGELEIHMIDVGQADATFLDGPDFNVLVDAGHWFGGEVVDFLENEGIEELDLLLITHPHADHMGEADDVIQEFEVQEVWMSGDTATSQTFEDVVDAIEASDAGYYEPRAGEVFEFNSLRLEVLHPEELTGDLHDGNIAVRAVFGDMRVMLTGDSEAPEEQEMMERDVELDLQVYQLGHHGSSTSSTREFLEEVDPDVGVYSAAEDSQYGHPHDEVVERFDDMDIDLYGTGEHGTVTIEANAEGEYEVSTEVDAPLVTPTIWIPVDADANMGVTAAP